MRERPGPKEVIEAEEMPTANKAEKNWWLGLVDFFSDSDYFLTKEAHKVFATESSSNAWRNRVVTPGYSAEQKMWVIFVFFY